MNGVATSLEITRENNSYKISTADLDVTLQVVKSDGEVVPLDADGNINGTDGDVIVVDVTGAQPNDDINVWMFSTPIQIGQGEISDDGKFSGRFEIPSEINGGSHRLVLKTVSYTGNETTVSVGFVVGSGNDGNSAISVIIFGILGVAVAFALIIPATRRRRRMKMAEV